MFSHPNQTIYVFLCFFVNSYHNNNIYSFRLIWSEILGRSTDLFFSSKWALFLSFLAIFWFWLVSSHTAQKWIFFYSNYPRDIDFSQIKSEIQMLWMGYAQWGRQLHLYTLLKAELPDQENCAYQTCFQWWNPMSLVIMCYQPSDAINRPENAN